MINRNYDSNFPYKYVVYLRESISIRNASSLDQQDNSIEEAIRRLGHPWQRIGTYRDEGACGSDLTERPEFQRMLLEIKSRRVGPNLIVIDIRSRLGRGEGLMAIERELRESYGVLIVDAFSSFDDPEAEPPTE